MVTFTTGLAPTATPTTWRRPVVKADLHPYTQNYETGTAILFDLRDDCSAPWSSERS